MLEFMLFEIFHYMICGEPYKHCKNVCYFWKYMLLYKIKRNDNKCTNFVKNVVIFGVAMTI